MKNKNYKIQDVNVITKRKNDSEKTIVKVIAKAGQAYSNSVDCCVHSHGEKIIISFLGADGYNYETIIDETILKQIDKYRK